MLIQALTVYLLSGFFGDLQVGVHATRVRRAASLRVHALPLHLAPAPEIRHAAHRSDVEGNRQAADRSPLLDQDHVRTV